MWDTLDPTPVHAPLPNDWRPHAPAVETAALEELMDAGFDEEAAAEVVADPRLTPEAVAVRRAREAKREANRQARHARGQQRDVGGDLNEVRTALSHMVMLAENAAHTALHLDEQLDRDMASLAGQARHALTLIKALCAEQGVAS
jgi:hypothetical protein